MIYPEDSIQSNSDTSIIRLQSDQLAVEVLPDRGAVITSVVDRHGNEYMADALHARPAALQLNAGFNDGGLGGIDDCLPAVSGGVYPAGPFKGWSVPDHGEVWQRAWQVDRINPQEAIFSIQGLQLPYTFTRRMLVDKARLHLDYSLTNHSQFDLPVVWASHPMLRFTPETRLDLGAIESLTVEVSSFGAPFGTRLPYPMVKIQGSLVDLKQISSLPCGVFLKAFAPHPRVSLVEVSYPEWSTTLRIITEAPRPLHIGIWWNKAGFPVESPLEHISLEPTFGSSDSLEYSYRDGSCLMLGAHTTEKWTLEYQVIDQLDEGK